MKHTSLLRGYETMWDLGYANHGEKGLIFYFFFSPLIFQMTVLILGYSTDFLMTCCCGATSCLYNMLTYLKDCSVFPVIDIKYIYILYMCVRINTPNRKWTGLWQASAWGIGAFHQGASPQMERAQSKGECAHPSELKLMFLQCIWRECSWEQGRQHKVDIHATCMSITENFKSSWKSKVFFSIW